MAERHQRLGELVDVRDLAVGSHREADRGALLARPAQHDLAEEHHLDPRVELLDLEGRRHRRGLGGGAVEMQVDDVLAGLDAADRDDLLVERVDDLAAADPHGVVAVAEVVAIEMHQPGLALAEPDEVAGRVLDIEVDILAAPVRPGEGDEELGLGIDRAGLRDRIDHEEGEHEHHDEAEQRVEQQIGEGDAEPVMPPHGRGLPRSSAGCAPRSAAWCAGPARRPRHPAETPGPSAACRRSGR